MKHFEQIWQDSEEVAQQAISSESDFFHQLSSKMEELRVATGESKGLITGDILFLLSYYSIANNINVYSALVEAKNNAQISLLDEEEV